MQQLVRIYHITPLFSCIRRAADEQNLAHTDTLREKLSYNFQNLRRSVQVLSKVDIFTR